MGKAFITSRIVDSDPLKGSYAIIVVEYPEGSRLICTDGVVTYKTENRWGNWVFGVSHAGEWDLIMSDGRRTTTYIITIQDRNQVEYVKMIYDPVLFERGISNIGWTGSKRGSPETHYGKIVTSLESGLVFDNPRSNSSGTATGGIGGAAHVMTKSPIDLTGYSTLCITTATNFPISYGLTDIDSDVVQDWICSSSASSIDTHRLDISQFSGERHRVILACPWTGVAQYNTIIKVWME